MSRQRRAPAGLGSSGRALWRDVAGAFAESDFELDEREQHLLAAACRQADVVAELEVVVAAEGLMVAGSRGQRVLHPAVAEARQGRLVLQRLLAGVPLPAEDGRPLTAAQERGRKAAESRWATVRAIRGDRAS